MANLELQFAVERTNPLLKVSILGCQSLWRPEGFFKFPLTPDEIRTVIHERERVLFCDEIIFFMYAVMG